MYAIGHFAIGYLAGKGTSKLFNTKINMPLLLLASIIPDTDLVLEVFYPNIFQHRVLTHSIITLTVIMIPFFILYGKKALPYYVALLSHALIGDFFIGGAQILWPLSHVTYGFINLEVIGLISVVAEIALFLISLAIMVWQKDLQSLLKPNKLNLTLVIPFVAVLGPLLMNLIYNELGYFAEAFLPTVLWLPSIFWLIIFAYSMLTELHAVLSLGIIRSSSELDRVSSNHKKLINR